MQKFAWTALGPDGQMKKGTVEAIDSRAVAEWLNRDGYVVVSVHKVKWPPTNYHLETIGRRDLIHFSFKFLPLVASNLALGRSLEILRDEIKKHRIKNALISIQRDMNNGSDLSHAMARHEDIFPTSYVSAIRAGEESGDMERSLSMMGTYLEWLDKTVRQIFAVLAYPVVVLMAMTFLAGVLSFFVLPVFIDLYERLGFEFQMPLPTKIVFTASTLFKTYWYVPLMVIGLVVFLWMARKRIPKFQVWTHRSALRLPFIGKMIRQLQALQFCRFFHLLHSNGIDTKRALAESQNVMTNIPMKKAVSQISNRLDQGMTLGEAFHHAPEFPTLVAEQIRVGEESGNVTQSMEYVIRYYDAELDYSIRRFTAILGPVLIFVLAMFLLLLALGFYLPLFEIASNLTDQ